MISLNIEINIDDVITNTIEYESEARLSLEEISTLVPDHSSRDFNSRLWGDFKKEIWKQQNKKCAYCERQIAQNECHLEHFRPKTEVRDDANILVTRKAYWWLAYDHKNYLVSCPTCNLRKGNRFPILDEETRVEAMNLEDSTELGVDGTLRQEVACIVNPRFQDPAPHFAYMYEPLGNAPMVFLNNSSELGKSTIFISDLNRKRHNEEDSEDFLILKRGHKLKQFIKEVSKYVNWVELYELNVSNLHRLSKEHQEIMSEQKNNIEKKLSNICSQFLSDSSEFSGMCRWWFENEYELSHEFERIAS